MRKSIIKRKLKNNKPVLIAKTIFCVPEIVELFGIMGFDGVWICNEHIGIDPSMMRNMLQAARSGNIDTIVRPGENRSDDWIRFLEMGASALMIPHIKTAEQARELVSKTKFSPRGRRGYDGVGTDARFGLTPMLDYMAQANEETFLVVQIEDVDSVDHIEEISNVEGVDVVFVGPADLSIDMGIQGQFKHPRIVEVIQRVVKACESSSAVCGTWGGEPDYTRTLLEMGVKYITGISDTGILRKGLEASKNDFAKIGFQFND